MYHSFRAENFRGLVSLDLDDLSLVNILTGLNDAGKTSVLEAMFLHASGPLAGGTALQILRAGRGQDLTISNNPTEYGPWANLFSNFDTTKDIHFSARTSSGSYVLRLSEGRKDISSTISQGIGNNVNVAPRTNSLIIEERRGKSAAKQYTQSVDLNISSAAAQSISMGLDIRLVPAADGPFMRGVLVKGGLGPDLAQGYSDLRKRRGAIDILDILQIIDDRIVALEVLVAEGRPQLHVDLGTDTLIPFELLGDGPVALARYLVAILQARDGIVFIDEIGTGLHHSVLTRVWKALYRAASRYNVQLVATTHSDEMLRAISTAMVNHRSSLRVYRLRRRGESSETQVSIYSEAKLTAALEMNAELR